MSDHKRLYIDVTQLVHWSGKLTGIPRVMHELAIRFRRDYRQAVFVVWVKEIRQFCEIDLDATLSHRGRGIIYLKPDDDRGATDAAPLESLSRVPTGILKRGVIRITKTILRHSESVTPVLSRRLENELKRVRMRQYKVAEPGRGEALFIPWGEWWDPEFAKKLVTLHERGVKLVQIVHDIATIVCPQFFEQVAVSPADYNSRILPIADLVLVVSKNTKRELENWLVSNELAVPSIKVFRNGEDLHVSKPVRPADPAFEKSGLNGKDYVLCVGTIEIKKNHMLFYYVYKLAKSRNIDLPKMVIVGRKGWMSEVEYALMTKDPEVKDKFAFLLNTSDEELSWLYDNCLFTVLASFHEGWGIPIAESLARGVPCLCSNTSSMVEIAEGFVGHFSPASSDELLSAMQEWLMPSALAAARDKAKQYKQFSWDESFGQVTKHMEGIL